MNNSDLTNNMLNSLLFIMIGMIYLDLVPVGYYFKTNLKEGRITTLKSATSIYIFYNLQV